MNKINKIRELEKRVEECYDIRRALKRRLKKETDPDVVEFKNRAMDMVNK